MDDEFKRQDEDMTHFEALLLSAGKRDRPTAANRERIVTGLGIGSALPTLLAGKSHAQSLSWFRRGLRALSKPWALGGIGVAAVASGLAFSRSEPPAPARPIAAPAAPARAIEPATQNTEPAPAPGALPAQLEPEANAAPAPRRGTARSSSAPTVEESSTLAAELAQLDVARRAVAAHNPRQALRVLDDYERRFPKPHLPTEATVLRIEALVGSGANARAQKLGEALLAKQPNSPYERRIRSLLGDPKRSAP